MKTFIQHDFPKLERVEKDGLRLYQTPSGKAYPSVTTVTGLVKKDSIAKWRAQVGEAAANKISARATKRGTAVHSLCEQFLLGHNPEPSPFEHEMFKSLVPHLDRIDNIHCLETQMYSNELEVAGTADCIAEYDGELCVIDFKTATRVKSRSDVPDYFMQTAAYSVMFEENTSIPVKYVLLVIGVDHHDPIVYREDAADWVDNFKEIRHLYRMANGH